MRTKILALLNRATHEATPTEEARTSAMIAAKLIAQYGYPVSEGAAPAASKSKPRDQKSWRGIQSRFSGYCKFCGSNYEVGELVAWMPGKGATHLDCSEFWDGGWA